MCKQAPACRTLVPGPIRESQSISPGPQCNHDART
jgi:hypothetical protein